MHPNAKAFGYGEHACIQMGASKCEGIRLRRTCACIQMRRHSATANMRVSKWVHPNAKAFGYGEHVHPNAKAFGYGEHVLRRKRNKRRKMSNWKYYGTTHFSFKNSFEAQHLFQQVGQGHAEGGPESDDEERHHHHTVKGDHGFRDPHDVAVPHPGADE